MDLIVEFEGREEKVRVDRRSASEVAVTVGERTYVVDASTGGATWSLLIDGHQHEVAVGREANGTYRVGVRGDTHHVGVFDPLEHAVRASGAAAGAQGAQRVDALMPGRVVKVLAKEGESVEAGQGVVVVEAMKMENEISAETSGVIAQLAVEEGQAVDAGDLLFTVEDAEAAAE